MFSAELQTVEQENEAGGVKHIGPSAGQHEDFHNEAATKVLRNKYN